MPRMPIALPCDDDLPWPLVHAARLFDDARGRTFSNAGQKLALGEAWGNIADDQLHAMYTRRAWDAEGFEPISPQTDYRGLEIVGESLVGRLMLEGNASLLYDAFIHHALNPTLPALLCTTAWGDTFNLSPMGHFIAQGGSPLALAWRDMLSRPDGFARTFPEWDASSEVRQALAVLRQATAVNFDDVKLDPLFCSTVCIALKRVASFDPDVLLPFALAGRLQDEGYNGAVSAMVQLENHMGSDTNAHERGKGLLLQALASGANLAPGPAQESLLHLQARQQNVPQVLMLLEAGHNPEHRNAYSKTASDVAADLVPDGAVVQVLRAWTARQAATRALNDMLPRSEPPWP